LAHPSVKVPVADRAIVVAVGGNALAPAGEEGTITEQFRHTRESLSAIVELARSGWRIALVHGNGPQVGNALIQQEMARQLIPPLPLGVLVAGTQGWIGYMIQQSLENALARAGVNRKVVTIVTQVLVDRRDPALERPSKPIGRTMDEETARLLLAACEGDQGLFERVRPFVHLLRQDLRGLPMIFTGRRHFKH
jgi:carbamate kinase